MVLTEIDILSGIFSITSIIIFTFLGLIIISKYFQHRRRDLLLFGITVAGLITPLYGSALSFLTALFTGQGLSVELYLFISLAPNPIILICFATAVTDLLYKEKQKVIQLIVTIYAIIIEILLIYFLINEPSMIGVLVGITDAEYGIIARYYLISVLAFLVIAGTLFARESLKSDRAEIKLKGKLLLPAFYLFAFSAIADAAIKLNTITLPLIRILVIISGILFYMGFILPESIKNFFLKEKKKTNN
ncbi:MAG: hypothetical protein ACFFAO_07540 [Candidatus Hermodarchaeota archaeon]